MPSDATDGKDGEAASRPSNPAVVKAARLLSAGEAGDGSGVRRSGTGVACEDSTGLGVAPGDASGMDACAVPPSTTALSGAGAAARSISAASSC